MAFDKLIDKSSFLSKYRINVDDFKKTTLQWSELEKLHSDYCGQLSKLEHSASFISNMLMKADGVHSVRHRVKDPEHLIEKIIRKRIGNPDRIITLENYQDQITDLIGVRALHLFKGDWKKIHEFVIEHWDTKEDPVANHRNGDSADYLEQYTKYGVKTKEHPANYRSIHYTVTTKPSKQIHVAEIQVRTIYEEAWSEIDHTIRYPYEMDNPIYNSFLNILNQFSGSADEMGTFIFGLKTHLSSISTELLSRDKELEKEVESRDNKVQEILDLVGKSEIGKEQKEQILNGIRSIDSSMKQTKLDDLSSEVMRGVVKAFMGLDPKLKIDWLDMKIGQHLLNF